MLILVWAPYLENHCTRLTEKNIILLPLTDKAAWFSTSGLGAPPLIWYQFWSKKRVFNAINLSDLSVIKSHLLLIPFTLVSYTLNGWIAAVVPSFLMPGSQSQLLCLPTSHPIASYMTLAFNSLTCQMPATWAPTSQVDSALIFIMS